MKHFEAINMLAPSNDLEPYISKQTLDFHHKKHHQTYYDNLCKLIQNTPYAQMNLIEIIQHSHKNMDTAIFNNAGQLYNHNFLWACLGNNTSISAPLMEAIQKQFGSVEEMLQQYKTSAQKHFGSGWSWLVIRNNELTFINTTNAEPAFIYDCIPLAVVDLWEHAYYLDYQNKRNDHICDLISNRINWDFVSSQFEQTQS